MPTRANKSSETKNKSNSTANVFDLIDLASKRLKSIQRRVIRETGLTPPQYFLLTLLWERDGRRARELADASNCSPATITGVLDSLEKNGLVSRQPNPVDRRSLLIKLTEAGRALKNSGAAKEEMLGNCCTGLNSHEFKKLGELLNKLNDSLI